jgi:plasmid maintenance system antidote protein VapI
MRLTQLLGNAFFATAPQVWINLQTDHDLSLAAIAARAVLAAIKPLAAA